MKKYRVKGFTLEYSENVGIETYNDINNVNISGFVNLSTDDEQKEFFDAIGKSKQMYISFEDIKNEDEI